MRRTIILILLVSLSLSACDNDWENNYNENYNNYDDYNESNNNEDTESPPDPTEKPEIESPPSGPKQPSMTKLDLWASGETLLRGANIWQAIVIPALDGLEFKGSGPVGPNGSPSRFGSTDVSSSARPTRTRGLT